MGRLVRPQSLLFRSLAGQGAKILRFLKAAGRIQCVKDGIQDTRIFSKEELAQLDADKTPTTPSFSKDTGADILELVANATAQGAVGLRLYLDFVKDGTFCEWAYVVDLDKDVFEVYDNSDEVMKRDGVGRLIEVEGVAVSLNQSFAIAKSPESEAEFEKACKAVEYIDDEDAGQYNSAVEEDEKWEACERRGSVPVKGLSAQTWVS